MSLQLDIFAISPGRLNAHSDLAPRARFHPEGLFILEV